MWPAIEPVMRICPLPALRHLLGDRLDQQQGAGDVGVDDVAPFRRCLVEEAVAETVTGIGDQHVDLAVADLLQQLLHALLGRQVGVDRIDLALQTGAGVDHRGVRRDDQIITVSRSEARDFEADARGGTGNDC